MKKLLHSLLTTGFVLSFALTAVLGWHIFDAAGANYTWDNGGGDGLWSTCTNWSSNICPGASDTAIFNPATSNTSSTIDPGFTGSVLGISMLTGFTGTITQSRSLTVGGNDLTVTGGTFAGGSADIDINGILAITGGDFTSTSGTLFISEDLIHTSGTFTHNSGTVTMDSAASNSQIDVPTTATYNNLNVNLGGDSIGLYNFDSDVIIVVGTLTLTNGNINTTLTVDARGPITHTSTFDGGTGLILISAGATDINAVTSGQFPRVTLSTARNLNMTAGSVIFDGTLTVEDGGIFNGSSGTTEVRGSFALTGASTFEASSGTTFIGSTTVNAAHDTFTVGSGTTFDANGGTVEIGNRRIVDINVDTSLTMFNLNIDMFSDGMDFNIATGDTLVTTGQLLLEEGIVYGGTIEVQGTYSHLTTYGACSGLGAGTTIIHVTVPITIAPALDESNYVCFPGLNLDDVGATFTGADTGNTNLFGGNLTLTAGTFDNTEATTWVASDADFDLVGGTFNHDNGAFLFLGGDQSISGSPTFDDLTIRSTSMIFEANETTTINGDFSMVGQSGVAMTVQSSSAGTQANIDFNGASYTLNTLNVQDNEWIAASPAECIFACTSSGNNTNWTFDKEIVVGNISTQTTEASGTATFTVVLNQEPDASVSIGVTSSDLTEGTVSPASLTFTTVNWETPQTVTVTGVDDVLNDEAIDFTIVLAVATSTDITYSGQNPRDITVRNLDNDEVADNIDYDFPTDYLEQTPAKTELNGFVARMSEDDFIATNEVTVTGAGGDIIYDSLNNSLWFGGDNDNVYQYEITTDTLNSHVIGGVGGTALYVTHDTEPTRNRIWVSSPDDNEIVAFDDDGTVFGSFAVNVPVNFNPTPNRILFVNANDANAANDSIWVGNENVAGLAAVTKYNAATGAPYITDLATSTFALTATNTVAASVQALAYDTDSNVVWVASTNDAGETILIAFNQATGAPLSGSLATSTYVIPPIVVGQMEYDSANDLLWIMGNDVVLAVDPDDGLVNTIFETDAALTDAGINTGLLVDTANNILIISDIDGNIYRYDIDAQYFLETYTSSDGSGDMTFDSEGDIWVIEAEFIAGDGFSNIGDPAIEEVRYGVTVNNYYTVLTDTAAIVDSSAWADLSAVTVTQTLDSGFIYYSLAFGSGNTYAVYTAGWRNIASSSAAVHGGVDGTWYYRSNASVWTAASSNNVQTALSQAVAAGANNQMTGAALNALTGANLVSAGGWTSSIDEVRVGTTFYSTDHRNNPEVDNILFTTEAEVGGGGGGGGSVPTYTDDEAISSVSCTASQLVELTLSGLRVDEYLVAETASFLNTTWATFVPDEVGGTSMTVPFTLSSGDGEKTVYAKFRSTTDDQSGVINTVIELDEANDCTDVVPPGDEEPETPVEEDPGEDGDFGGPDPLETPGTDGPSELSYIGCEGVPMPSISIADQERYRLGVSPMEGEYVPISFIYPGDYMRSANFDTVYCITEDLERRAFMDETTFFTQTRTFTPVKWVADETLTEFPLSFPMLPRQDVNFLKFESDPSIYHFIQDPLDPAHGILHWVTTEDLAAFIAGENWSDYVIDLNPTLVDRFIYSAPLLTIDDVLALDIELTDFRARELLNEISSEEVDEGIISSLLEQGRELLNAAGQFFKANYRQLQATFQRR